jgi:small subunit ribosomal protein S1
MRTEPFGAFVEVGPGIEGLLHVSELGAGKRLVHARQAVKVGQKLQVTVGQIDRDRRRLSLTLARAAEDGDEVDTGPASAPQAIHMGTFADLLKNAGKPKEKKK